MLVRVLLTEVHSQPDSLGFYLSNNNLYVLTGYHIATHYMYDLYNNQI